MGLPASTMGTKSQKPDRESTAAYAASQPLFSALRSASDEISKQKAHLAKARDIVQTLHVKLVDTTNIDDSEKHDQYMECVVKAWTSATEAYCNIFTELCAVTAPDPAVGRVAGRGYEQFKVMERLAATASYQVKEYPAKQTSGVSAGAKLEPPTALGKRARDADEVGQAGDQGSKRSRKRARQLARKTSDTGANGGAESKHEVKTEKVEPNGEVKTEVEPEVNVKKEPNVKIKREPVSPEQDHVDPEPVSAGKENSVPAVEYEDASAEVAARLKAKEEKRKAKKEAKKRKRDSGDSAVTEPTTTEKPSKKKAKVVEETVSEKAKETPSKAEAAPISNGGAVQEQQVKRKGDDGTGKGDAGPKKRKKVKA
ncbi:hypothetical protein LTR17_008021 [Elasticomyces elasticus]|nr:hypothetical protein LTR17_008021 [Elasticomyces elasticus]